MKAGLSGPARVLYPSCPRKDLVGEFEQLVWSQVRDDEAQESPSRRPGGVACEV